MQLMVNAHSDKVDVSEVAKELEEDGITFEEKDTKHKGADEIVWSWSIPWWRHQMETYPALLAIYAGNSPATGEFPTQRPVTRSFDVFFDLSLNKRLSKQWRGWWFETHSRSLWRHCSDLYLPAGNCSP